MRVRSLGPRGVDDAEVRCCGGMLPARREPGAYGAQAFELGQASVEGLCRHDGSERLQSRIVGVVEDHGRGSWVFALGEADADDVLRADDVEVGHVVTAPTAAGVVAHKAVGVGMSGFEAERPRVHGGGVGPELEDVVSGAQEAGVDRHLVPRVPGQLWGHEGEGSAVDGDVERAVRPFVGPGDEVQCGGRGGRREGEDLAGSAEGGQLLGEVRHGVAGLGVVELAHGWVPFGSLE